MSSERIKTEEFWNPEHIVEKFWNGLKDGVIYGRKCNECGAIEFPPHLACNSCGYHETEWTTLSGKGQLKSCVHRSFKCKTGAGGSWIKVCVWRSRTGRRSIDQCCNSWDQ